MNAKKNTTTNKTKASRMAAAAEEVRKRLGLETLEDRKRDALDFHDISVASIRDAIAIAFEAGFAAGTGAPAPFKFDPTDPGAMLDTLDITKKTGRPTGGTWVKGNIGNHAFEALVFPEHATDAAFELDDSRISKLWLQEHFTHTEVACFDRGWDRQPTTEAARAIVGLLSAGLAEHVFGK